MGKRLGIASLGRWLGLASIVLVSLGCGGARPLPPYPAPDRVPIEETDLAPYVAAAHDAQAAPPSEGTPSASSEATSPAAGEATTGSSQATPPAASEATTPASSPTTPPATSAPRARRAPSSGGARR